MNCGGGDATQSWGNTWALGTSGWRTYLYGYDGSKYDFTFQLIDNNSMQFVPGALMSEPTPEINNGQPSGQLYIEVTGVDLTAVGSYRLRMIYHPYSDPTKVTTTDTAFIVSPFSGCYVSSTFLSPCPPG